ncbi:hypothetical protein B296_00028859 [Ensete ventricosum]|uniref:Uncharacterized protein n=1 Tax=Ensete ventricosum TaxID=4639 RepID=A0A427AM46_ENSVE|nr:hypothetical protein B296_00028859 [Ensete ventricosum]
MFLLPMRSEEIACGRQIGRAAPDSRFSLYFFLPPSADTTRNRPPMTEIDRYHLTTTDDDRFWVVTAWKQPQSAVLPGSRRSMY